jgi:hypothetical protein
VAHFLCLFIWAKIAKVSAIGRDGIHKKTYQIVVNMANKIATKKNIEKLKAALIKHDIKPSDTKVIGDSRSAQATPNLCIRKERT